MAQHTVRVGLRLAWWLRPAFVLMKAAARCGFKWSDETIAAITRRALITYIA